jgi:hypothetical protein
LKIGHLVVAILAAAVSQGCDHPTAVPPAPKPQSIVLLVTPKMIPDFDNPGPAVAAFLDHYRSLTSRGAETIVVFGVGNSDHILNYRGSGYWSDRAEWARLTDGAPVSTRSLDYHQIAGVVAAFKAGAAAFGMNLKVSDLIDSGTEFTQANNFKDYRHNECMTIEFLSYNVGARLLADDSVYASAPNGITAGTLCGHFLVDQTARYLEDLGFDGILYKNQLGTRGRWVPGNGPGYSDAEAAAIDEFLEYSRTALAGWDLMWFDSYNNVSIERETFSFPANGYRHFDYLIASGFCVVTSSERYLDNLRSKLEHANGPRILATLDYVDPWYTYDSMDDFPGESARLEEIAIEYRDQIDGIMFFAHDEVGAPVPRGVIESFVLRFYRPE